MTASLNKNIPDRLQCLLPSSLQGRVHFHTATRPDQKLLMLAAGHEESHHIMISWSSQDSVAVTVWSPDDDKYSSKRRILTYRTINLILSADCPAGLNVIVLRPESGRTASA